MAFVEGFDLGYHAFGQVVHPGRGVVFAEEDSACRGADVVDGAEFVELEWAVAAAEGIIEGVAAEEPFVGQAGDCVGGFEARDVELVSEGVELAAAARGVADRGVGLDRGCDEFEDGFEV